MSLNASLSPYQKRARRAGPHARYGRLVRRFRAAATLTGTNATVSAAEANAAAESDPSMSWARRPGRRL